MPTSQWPQACSSARGKAAPIAQVRETAEQAMRFVAPVLRTLVAWCHSQNHYSITAYILPKVKTCYQSGRPMVSFYSAPFRPLLQAVRTSDKPDLML